MLSRQFFLGVILSVVGFSCFAELPVCGKNCDNNWNACAQSCTGNSNQWQCTSMCGEQHESCLNACKSTSTSVTRKVSGAEKGYPSRTGASDVGRSPSSER